VLDRPTHSSWQSLSTEALQTSAGERVQYIARLSSNEVHVLAPRDVIDIRQLDRRRVNIGRWDSGNNLKARQLFAQLGVKPIYEETDHAAALEKLQRGQIDAALILERRPAAIIRNFQADGRFHFLPIPYGEGPAQGFVASRFSAQDYPDLVESRGPIETVGVATVLAVPNVPEGSERYRRLAEFTKIFARFGELQERGHRIWTTVEPSASVAGSQRFKPAEEALRSSASPRLDGSAIEEQRRPKQHEYDKKIDALTRAPTPALTSICSGC
jgi:hypothetical protein